MLKLIISSSTQESTPKLNIQECYKCSKLNERFSHIWKLCSSTRFSPKKSWQQLKGWWTISIAATNANSLSGNVAQLLYYQKVLSNAFLDFFAITEHNTTEDALSAAINMPAVVYSSHETGIDGTPCSAAAAIIKPSGLDPDLELNGDKTSIPGIGQNVCVSNLKVSEKIIFIY